MYPLYTYITFIKNIKYKKLHKLLNAYIDKFCKYLKINNTKFLQSKYC